MPTINTIEASYRLYLSRLNKQSTRKDYTMRFNVFLTWCSMERIDRLEEINFAQAIWSQLKNIPLFYTSIPT